MAETQSGWEVLTVKVTPAMRSRIEQFQAEAGEDKVSAALRLLIGAGLETKIGGEGDDLLESVKSNAMGEVMHRWGQIMDGAKELFWNDEYEPDPDEEEED